MNSALAGLMPARNINTEALYAVRGKLKNLMKHPLDECLENQEELNESAKRKFIQFPYRYLP